jgi:hypothetical protein
MKECLCIEHISYPVVFKNGITHYRVECVDCKRFIKWRPQSPRNFKLWFGKYKDKPLKEIPHDYLKWLKENNSNKKLVNKVNSYLESCVA